MDNNYNSFLDGNERIEAAISEYYSEDSTENLVGILDVIRQRMHEDGHFLFPVLADDENPDSFSFRTLQTADEKFWQPAFTSQDELEKGEPTDVISNFIDTSLKASLGSELEGIIINPWGNSFMLANELIQIMLDADGDVEYAVPDVEINAELLEDGSFLKKATEICNRNMTQLNMIKLFRILRDSYVWVPCTAILSEADMDMFERAAKEAEASGSLDSLVGQEFSTQNNVRLVPDILQNGDEFFFPVFTTVEEMGEYGESFSKVQKHFLDAIILAENNEQDVAGIVINAFSEPFVVNKEFFALIKEMESSIE